MNLDDLNKWLTLLANLGVLVGIVFLSLEISQSNRIAIRDARSELTTTNQDIELSFLENSEVTDLMVKLANSDKDLTPREKFQAYSYANIIVTAAANLNLNYENGFLEKVVLERYMRVQAAQIVRVPGITPFLEDALKAGGIDRKGISPVFDNLLEQVNQVAKASAEAPNSRP